MTAATTSPITTHVLDTARGVPAAGVPISLERSIAGAWSVVGRGVSDGDGRCRSLLPAGDAPVVGLYRLTFDTAAYFTARAEATFFPEVVVVFEVTTATHHHVPLLLSPFGYSTYRGS